VKRGFGGRGIWAAGCLAVLVSAPVRADELETAVRQAYPTNEGLLTQTTTSAVARLFLGFKIPDGTSLRMEPATENRANWFVEMHLLAYLSNAGYTAYLAKPSRVPEGAPAGPEALSRTLPPVRSRPEAGSLSAAVDSGAAMARGSDSTLAPGPDTLVAPAPSPETTESANQGPTSTAISGSDQSPPDFVLRYRVVLCELTYPEKFRNSPLGSRKVERRASVSLVAQLMQGARQDVVWVGKGNSQQVSVVPAGKLNYLAGTDFQFNPPPLEQKGMGGYVEPMLVTGIVAGLIYLFYANQN
jgi:hypothetical protein